MTMMAPPRASKVEMIESRIDKSVAGRISVGVRGLVVESLEQAMELAKMMSISGSAVPRHLRENPGACMAICITGYEWGINPFALANKTYDVNDRLAYESAIYHAVVQRRAPIKGRVKSEYRGDGPARKCRVWAILDDGSNDTVEYESPETGRIKPKNSPLWVNDPDQQLFYFSVRAFARRHFPDVMMGIYTVDELQDNPPDRQVASIGTAPSRVEQVKARITSRPVSEGQTFVPDEQDASERSAVPADVDASTGEVVPENDAQGQQESSQTDKPAIKEPAAGAFLSHEKFVEQMIDAALDLGVAESVLMPSIDIAIPLAKRNKVTPAERRQVWMNFCNGIAPFDR